MNVLELRCRRFETSVGTLRGLSDGTALVALEFTDERREARLDARLARWLSPYVIEEREDPPLAAAGAWLRGYFEGTSCEPASLPLAMHGTEFERRVWRALLDIPPGETTTYGALAATLGLRNGARAVGLANGANPLPIVVPCHRVIGAAGTLVGYGGGLSRKQWLLDHERRWSRAARLF